MRLSQKIPTQVDLNLWFKVTLYVEHLYFCVFKFITLFHVFAGGGDFHFFALSSFSLSLNTSWHHIGWDFFHSCHVSINILIWDFCEQLRKHLFGWNKLVAFSATWNKKKSSLEIIKNAYICSVIYCHIAALNLQTFNALVFLLSSKYSWKRNFSSFEILANKLCVSHPEETQ